MDNAPRVTRFCVWITLASAILGVGCSAGGRAGPSDAATSGDGSSGAGSSGAIGPGGSSSGGSSGAGGSSSSSGTSSGSSGSPGDDGGSGSNDGGPASATGPYYASPNGTGTACSAIHQCSITQAQMAVRAFAPAMQSDLVVQLADGIYRLSAPLKFTAADSGMNGHHVTWQAATASAQPILSSAQQVMGWTMHDAAKNIWQATVGTGFDSMQLFVDGVIAIRARTAVQRSDFTETATGFTFGAAFAYLNSVADQKRVAIHAIGGFTDRFSPVDSISNNQATMTQPAWKNNNWGYGTIFRPQVPDPIYLENAYEFLNAPGEWYLNTTTGVLYYIPLAGQDMTKVDVELPKLPLLMSVGGTYDQPVHDIVFHGLQFSHTSWLGPTTADGYASQQSGTFIVGGAYATFEAARGDWHETPGAVQISAAKNITIENSRFTNLGQLGLGIGNDPNANASGVGLGVDAITITGNVFAQNSAGGIIVGGVQTPNSHHPTDPRMIVQNVTINDNLIHDNGIDFRDAVGLFVSYTTNVVASHNEVYNMPYSGISFGYGWGIWDAGGSPDYVGRGTYQYWPTYATPTTARNNQLASNFVHNVMQVDGDGGCIHVLSANPGTVFEENHCLNLGFGSGAFYNDEGSRYWTWTNNVSEKAGPWAFANRSGGFTGDLILTGNWADNGSTDIVDGQYNNVVTGNVIVAGGAWPAAAQTVITNAGLEAAYKSLKP